jgi:hypothetical protein
MQIRFVYMVFGDQPVYHQQAAFSILSILAQKQAGDSILMLTNHPEYYAFFGEQVKTSTITPQTLEEWKGPHQYFWRIKLQAIAYAALGVDEQAIVYLDTDTFLFGDLEQMRSGLMAANSFMHLNEGSLAAHKSKTIKKMWRHLSGKEFAGIRIQGSHCMWNAGLVAMPAGKALPVLTKAIALCDAFCDARVSPRLIEQFSLSVSLSEQAALLPADHYFGHYWGNKPAWENYISSFFHLQFFQNQELKEQQEAFQKLDLRSLPVHIVYSNTRKRLQERVYKLFPDKRRVYIPR